MRIEQWWKDDQQGKTEEFGEKPTPVPPSPPRITLEPGSPQ